MYRLLSRFYPGRVRRKYKSLLNYCGMSINHESFVGMGVMMGLIAAAVAGGLHRLMTGFIGQETAIISIAIFALVQVMFYIFLLLRAEGKGKTIEDVLPDALLLMSMNIKSGMTTDRALITSARPEFGPLEKELMKAGKDIFTGSDIKTALLAMTQRIDSSLFDRTIRLIIEGIETGGELSSLLQQTAEDIQNTKLVQNEVRSSVLMYVIFIFFATGIGAPLLFGISTYLVSTIGTQFSAFSAGGLPEQTVGITLGVSQGFLVQFAIIALCITSFFGGLIMGVVKNGSEKAGIKFIPMLIIISLSVFFAVRIGVASVFPSF